MTNPKAAAARVGFVFEAQFQGIPASPAAVGRESQSRVRPLGSRAVPCDASAVLRVQVLVYIGVGLQVALASLSSAQKALFLPFGDPGEIAVITRRSHPQLADNLGFIPRYKELHPVV